MMQRQTLKRYLTYSLLVACFTLAAASARAQDRKTLGTGKPEELLITKGDCPRPIALTLTAQNPTSFVASDFAQIQLGAQHMTGLNDPSLDKNFLYTFRWKRDEKCCQITRAVLTVKMKSNGGGVSHTSSDAGNDGIAIMHAGASVPPFNEAVYSSVTVPFNPGQIATKTWNLTGAALNNINAFGTLSFAVQDDTSVVSATLQLWGCCLTATGREATEESNPRSQN